MKLVRYHFLCLLLPALSGLAQTATNVFTLQDGDRVALIGDTLIEREPESGYLEARLQTRFVGKKFIVRNLGWSADTPAGESRASFDFNQPGKGFERLKTQLDVLKPTVAFIGYGMASSFEGEKGVPKFKADLKRLADEIEKSSSPEKVRLVFFGAIRHEKLPAPLPDPTQHNVEIQLYNNAIKQVAEEKGALYIPLFDYLGDGMTARPPRPLTDDGIHLSAYGYLRMADVTEMAFGWLPNTWYVRIMPDGFSKGDPEGITVTNLDRQEDRARFWAVEEHLPNCVIEEGPGTLPSLTPLPMLRCVTLKADQYTLKIDGEPILAAFNPEWSRGTNLYHGPSFEQAEQLRQAIIEKNRLFFYRWRPQNETYLFGFRKHEQGQNAKEIAMFDPLIEEAEKKIRQLSQPVKHLYEIVPTKEAPVRRKLPPPKPDPQFSASPQPQPNFEVAPGFAISLFAENPQLAKPIQMNFDPAGRLWVASSSVYPQIEPGQKADDKILILDDTDGDGKADKTTVFVDGLLIPTGVEPGDGGCYVGQGTELLHFKTGLLGGKAAQRRVVLSSFGTEDTHHILHTLRWGPDGQLYFNQSIYIHTHIETPHGVVRLNSGGVWNLRPPTLELGVFLRGFCNPWGHVFDPFGQSFETDGAGFQGISYGIRDATYFTYAEMRREMKSISPGNYPKFAGLEIVQSEQFPPDWQGNFITCDFRAHRVVRFGVTEQGGGYVTSELPDLIRTTNVTFRPIDVKFGPDGALYVADWSNPIIQHGEVDFRDPRRDHEHGRIWRITATGRPLVPKKNLRMLGNQDLLAELLSPNSYNRDKARRVLTERGKIITNNLQEWTASLTEEKPLLEALWMYQSLDLLEPKLLEKLLQAKDGHVRAAALRVLSCWSPRLGNALDLLARGVTDAFPRARIEAVRGLGKIAGARSAELVLSALDQPMDYFVDYAVWLSINDLAAPWIEAIQNGSWKIEGREKQLEFGLKAIEPALAGVVLEKLLAQKPLDRSGTGPWIELIGQTGSSAELRKMFEQLTQDHFEPAAAARVLQALDEAARLRKVKPGGDLAALQKLLTHENHDIQVGAIRLAGDWKMSGATATLGKIAEQVSSTNGVVEAVMEGLREIGGRDAIAVLRRLAGKEFSPATRRSAVVALAGLNLPSAGAEIVEVLAQTQSESEALALWRSLLNIRGAGPVIARNLKSNLPDGVVKAGLRAARESGRKETELEIALSRSGNIGEETQGPSDAELQRLARETTQSGDAARGERIFRRPELGCVVCHAIGGAGGKVGPDLTSIGASAPVDYLVESIFYPNRKIKEGFHSVVVQTKDEQELSGLIVRENNEELILRDVANREISVPKNKIQSRTLGASLMPSGLIDALPANERLDLFRFLAELGRPGPFDASRTGVARLWRIRPGTHTVEQFGEEKFLNQPLTNTEWSVAYALTDGRLLRDDLRNGIFSNNPNRYSGIVAVYAATQFEMTKAGAASFQIDGASKPEVMIDGKTVARENNFRASVSAGTHSIVIKLNPQQLPDSLRVTSSDAAFLAN